MIAADEKKPAQLAGILAKQFAGSSTGATSGLIGAALRASAASSIKSGTLAERVGMSHSTAAAQIAGQIAGVGLHPADTFGLARLVEQVADTGAQPYNVTLGGPHQVDELADDFEVSAVADFAGLARQPNAAPEVFAAAAAASCLSLLVGAWLHEAAALNMPLDLAYFTLICGIDFIQKATRATYRHALKFAQDFQQ